MREEDNDQASEKSEDADAPDAVGPAAEVLGDYWGKRLKAHLEKGADQYERENIAAHASKVVDVTGAARDASPGQIVKVGKWIRVAADIPIEDAGRSAIIEAVLADIITKSSADVSEFQDVAERLSSKTAQLLLDIPVEHNISPKEADERAFEQLRSLGLASPPGRKRLLVNAAAWVIGTVIGSIILFEVVIPYAPKLLPRHLPYFLATEFIGDAVAVSALILVFGLIRLSTTYRLTDFGQSLQRAAKRFYRNKPRVPEKSVLPASARWTPALWGTFAALLICALPFVLQAYLPQQLRFDTQPPTVIISSPTPPTPSAPLQQTLGSSSPVLSQQQFKLSADDIRTLIDLWRSVDIQLNNINAVAVNGTNLLSNWPGEMADGGATLVSRLQKLRDEISRRRSSLQSLYNVYSRYPNVTVLDNIGAKGFDRLDAAIDGFASAVRNLSAPPPTNFENTLRPYAGELESALAAVVAWANDTQSFARNQGNQLSKIDLK